MRLFQVPSLEHNNEVKGESLDLLKYIDEQFEGPKILPEVMFCVRKFYYLRRFPKINVHSSLLHGRNCRMQLRRSLLKS